MKHKAKLLLFVVTVLLASCSYQYKPTTAGEVPAVIDTGMTLLPGIKSIENPAKISMHKINGWGVQLIFTDRRPELEITPGHVITTILVIKTPTEANTRVVGKIPEIDIPFEALPGMRYHLTADYKDNKYWVSVVDSKNKTVASTSFTVHLERAVLRFLP